MEKPFISVIVTAYNRKEFLLQAVSSALRQTLPRDFYEVIVVKNFEDEEIDRQLKHMGVTNLSSNSVGLGAKVSEALEIARGDVISPLEDDDMFSSDKLEVVRSVFERGDVVFLRNRRAFVDTKGRGIGEERAQPPFAARGSDPGALRKLIGLNAGCCCSAMSIRRSALYSADIERLKRLVLGVDSFYFAASLLHGGVLAYDPRPLTLYRFHGNQSFINTSSLDAYVRKRCEAAKVYANAYEDLMEMVRNTPYEVVVKPLLVRSKVVSTVFCRSESKPTTQELAYLLRYQNTNLDHPQDFLLLLGLMTAPILPPLRGLARRTEFELNKVARREVAQCGNPKRPRVRPLMGLGPDLAGVMKKPLPGVFRTVHPCDPRLAQCCLKRPRAPGL